MNRMIHDNCTAKPMERAEHTIWHMVPNRGSSMMECFTRQDVAEMHGNFREPAALLSFSSRVHVAYT